MSRLLLFASLEEKHALVDEDVLVILEELVEEQRITLADNESFADFAERYQIEKYEQTAAQQVAVQKKVVHDIFENRPLQEPFFNEEVDKQQDLIASTQQITENLLTAIDAAEEDIEEAWDLPDSDWGDWESDLTVKRPIESADIDFAHTSLFENDEIEEPSRKEPAEKNELDGEFPSADDIWNRGLDTQALENLISEQQEQRNTGPHQFDRAVKDQTAALQDDEHRWGGVWWMSNEQRNGPAGGAPAKSANDRKVAEQSSVPANRTASRINVEENLSMPSMWVDSCPDAVTGGGTAHPYAKPPQRNLARLLSRWASWLGIILLVALFYSLFAEQINHYFSGLQDNFDGVEVMDEQMTPRTLEVEDKSNQQIDDFKQDPVQSLARDHNQQNIERTDAIQSDVSQYPEDLSGGTIDRIDLATRYAVFFDFNKASIPTEYLPLLKAIQYKMLTEEETFLRIIGYADTQGDRSYNYRLSLKRADEVKQYFISRGIAGNRLHVTAVGTAEDDVKVLTLSESAKRRRVEMILFPN
jgi:outer membrane protein OmpA-like peptidoglycan-associated protein